MKLHWLASVACAGACSEPSAGADVDASTPGFVDAADEVIADRDQDHRAESGPNDRDAANDSMASDSSHADLETSTDVRQDGNEPERQDPMRDAAGPLCDCTAQNAVDRRGMATVTVLFGCCAFTPKCLRVSAGTTVRFSGNFISHPLSASRDSDQGGPALEVSSGSEASFEFPLPGSFGYYCTLHGFDQPLGGMCGAVLVEP